jgi:Protein of unknown function (DUF2567)
MAFDERSREEQICSDERSREEQMGSDERLREGVGPSRFSRSGAFLRVVVGLAVAGALVGMLWAGLAPSVQGVVALTRTGERVRAYVGDDADHLFTAAFVMVGFLSVLTVVSAALVWKWRSHRGPAMVCALTVGAISAAGAATGVGAALAHWRYGTVDVAGAPVSPEHRVHYVVEAPGVFFGHTPLQIAATIIVPAGLAALVYAICALCNARDDLGAWPPIEPVVMAVRPPGVTAENARLSGQ